MIDTIDPVWLAFSSGCLVGGVIVLSMVCLIWVLINRQACGDCPYLPGSEEAKRA